LLASIGLGLLGVSKFISFKTCHEVIPIDQLGFVQSDDQLPWHKVIGFSLVAFEDRGNDLFRSFPMDHVPQVFRLFVTVSHECPILFGVTLERFQSFNLGFEDLNSPLSFPKFLKEYLPLQQNPLVNRQIHVS
jgi:hypothetical protein